MAKENKLDLSDEDLLLLGRARKALETAREALAKRWSDGAVTVLLMEAMVADLTDIMDSESFPGQPEIIEKSLVEEDDYLAQRNTAILAALGTVTKTKPA